MRKRNPTDFFGDSATLNNLTFNQYCLRLTELAISVFEWDNLPPTVDGRFLEIGLFENAMMIYFNDTDIGNLCLNVTTNGNFNVYGYPTNRTAYSKYNNYQKHLNENDSVIIYNNLIRTNSLLDVQMFARRLYNLDRIIDVNANAQKTPVLIQCSEKQRLTMLNLYEKYEGNQPFIFGDKNLDIDNIKVLQTGAPYVCDKITELKTQIWNEALTYLGIPNITTQKKERMITDEVQRGQGGTVASRYSRLEARRQAADKINTMFGTNISVKYREDYSEMKEGANDE